MITRVGPLSHMHRAVEHAGLLYIGGVVAAEKGGSMAQQTRQITKKIDELLAAAGSDKTKLLTATIFVTDLSLKDEMNEVWQAWLPKEHLPARATVGVRDLGDGYLIEVTGIAAK